MHFRGVDSLNFYQTGGCNENLFLASYTTGDDGCFACRLPKGGERGDSHSDCCAKRYARFFAFVRDDSPRRYREMDLESEFPQQHFRYARRTQRNLEFRNSQSRSKLQSYLQ